MLTDIERRALVTRRREYDSQVAAITGSDLLTDKAKRIEVGRARRALRADLAAFHEGATRRSAAEIHAARYRMAGLKDLGGADRIALRDAQDRAAACTTPAEARQLWLRAEQYGDTELAAAVAMRALDQAATPLGHPWGAVFNDWLQQHPEHQEAVDVLAAETGGDTSRRLSDRLYYELPDLPVAYRNAEADAAEADAELAAQTTNPAT